MRLCRCRARQGTRQAFSDHSRTPVAGFSAVEFLLVSVPVMLLTLGGVELSHWFSVRQMVDLALVEAARAGATQHAQPAVIAHAFEHALRPLFAAPTPQAAYARLARALDQRRQAMHGAPPWQIRILRPDARDYARFNDPALAAAQGHPTIRNDYQTEQQQRHAGVADSASDEADRTIFAANTLELRLIYPHAPLLPGIGHLLASLQPSRDDYTSLALAAGLLPIVREIRLDMASHPVDWPPLPDGRVIKGKTSNAAVGAIQPGDATCVGLWCTPQPPSISPVPLPETAGGGDPGAAEPVNELPGWEPGSGEDDEAPLPGEPECP